MDEKDYYTLHPLEDICHACLSQNRNTFPLGNYRDIFIRLIPIYKTSNAHIKLCWECLAVLRRFYLFEKKCYIAHKVLSHKWRNNKRKCLSRLSTTPVNVHSFADNNENNRDITKPYQDIKEEEISNNNIDEYDEPFDYINENEPDYGINYDDGTNENRDELRIQNENDIKVFDDKVGIKVNCEFETFNTVKKDEDSTVNTNNVSHLNLSLTDKVKLEDKEAKVETEVQPRRKQKYTKFSRNELRDHYRIIKKDADKAKYLKVRIEEEHLEELRNSERTMDFFVKKQFKCDDCVCSFQKLSDLSRHNKNVHDESLGRFTCEICKARIATRTELAAHVSKHYYVHKCTECDFNCYSKQLIKSHVKLHKRSVQCLHCSLDFSNTALFFKHFKANHAVFVCDHCGKKCRTKYTLEKHMRHHNEPNICVICNKVYKSRNSLRNHCELKHNEASGELAYCVQCDKQFANVALYKRHVLSSAAHAPERDGGRGNKQVRCPLCEKVYSRKTYMMNHYRYVHMKQSKHYCVDCDRHFLNRTRYVEHRKYQHEGELKVKDKMCNICGRGFAANRTLRNHILTHSGERPYECAHCDASFTQKHCMVSHVKYIHMKNKRRGLS